MKKIFNVTSVSPFDLMRWGKDATYDKFSEEYNIRFNKDIEILEANTELIKNGVRVSILAYRLAEQG